MYAGSPGTACPLPLHILSAQWLFVPLKTLPLCCLLRVWSKVSPKTSCDRFMPELSIRVSRWGVIGLAWAPSKSKTTPTWLSHNWVLWPLWKSEAKLYKIDKWTGRKQSPWSRPSNTMLKNILKKIWNISDLENAVMKIPMRVLVPKWNHSV